MGAWPLALLLWFCGSTSASAQHQTTPPLGLQDEGGTEAKPVFTLDCVGDGIVCSQSGTTGTLTVGGGGSGNSFETITPPAGASVVAESSTDTLTITEDTFLTITGTAATDTIAITQVTTDIGTDGLVAANAVALTTDTTGDYVGTIGDCTASEGAACFEGTAGTTLTFNDASGDQTLIYNVGADLDFNFSDDLNVRDATPHLRWIDTTASEDDFECYADASQFYCTNVTDAIELIRFNASNNLFLRGGSITYSWPTTDGTSGQFISTNGSGVLSFATGSGGNSFETIAVPAGASVVAESSTDTLTLTETSFLTLTGTAATDTIDITQVTTDLGTDGLIAANAVALTTDTTGNYVGTVGDCTASEGAACFTGAVGTALTSNTDLIMALDDDNNGTESFQVLDGVDAMVAEIPESGILNTIDLLDGVGAVDMDYGSADITDHTFITDGTTDADFVVPLTSIGAGEIVANDLTTTQLAATLTFADADLLDFGTNISAVNEGILIPAHATTCASATSEGQLCWEEDADNLWIGDGAAAKQMNGGSDTNADKEFIWPMSALLPLEAADSIPPLAKDAGTNVDMLPVDFDQSTDECRTFTFLAPPDITAGGTVTFTVIWYSASVTTNNVIWDIRHNSGVAEGVDPDAALTTVAAAADAVQGTAGQITVTTWTETQTNLAWAASDSVVGVVCRDANAAGDTFAADGRAILFGVRIPRS